MSCRCRLSGVIGGADGSAEGTAVPGVGFALENDLSDGKGASGWTGVRAAGAAFGVAGADGVACVGG